MICRCPNCRGCGWHTVDIVFDPPVKKTDASSGLPHCAPCFLKHIECWRQGTETIEPENLTAFKQFLSDNPEIGLEI